MGNWPNLGPRGRFIVLFLSCPLQTYGAPPPPPQAGPPVLQGCGSTPYTDDYDVTRWGIQVEEERIAGIKVCLDLTWTEGGGGGVKVAELLNTANIKTL